MTAQTAAGPGPGQPATPPRRGKLYSVDLAGLAGVEPKTISHYNSIATGNRAAGRTRPRDLPAPDGYDPNPAGGPALPWWRPATVRPWLATRHNPGRARKDGRSPVPPGTRLGRPPRRPGPKPQDRSTTD
jgi:hypothetical protein